MIDPTLTVKEAMTPDTKFVDTDVTDVLHLAGITYLTTYSGGFEYLLDLQARFNQGRTMSIGQVRGILNCIRAEVLRDDKPTNNAPQVANGRYAITVGEKLRFFHVNSPADGKWTGFTFVKEFVGGGNEFSIRDTRNQILSAIANDPDALARYGS